MGILDGKHITARNNLDEYFMLAFGSDRHGGRIVFIDIERGKQFILFCDTVFFAEQIATKMAYDLLNNYMYNILHKYGFEELK